jgi:hypothetical protein
MHHQFAASHTSEADAHGAFTAPANLNELAIDDGGTANDALTFVDSAPHCDSGPCAASVDTGSKNIHVSVTGRYIALRQPGTGALVPPLIRPPNLSSKIS